MEAQGKLRPEARRRLQAYQRIFPEGSVDAAVVLSDLDRFCRGHASTYDSNPFRSAYQQGQRDVFLRICSYLRLTEDDLEAVARRSIATMGGE